MTGFYGNQPAIGQPHSPAVWQGAGPMTPQDDGEPRMPSILAFVAGCYLISVPLLSAAERFGASWIPQAIAIAVVLSWLVFGVMQGRKLVLSKPVMLYAAWALWACTGFLVTPNPTSYMLSLTTIVKVVIITWLCSQCVRTRADMLLCLIMVSMAPVIIFVEGVDEIVRAATYAGETQSGRTEGGSTLVSNANSLAMTAVVLILTSLTCFFAYRSFFLKFLALATLPCGLYIVAASGSRTGMVGMLIAGLGIFWFHFRRAGAGDSSKKLVMFLTGFAFLAGAAVFVVKSPFFFRLADTFSSTQDATRQPRFVYFIIAMKATAQRPIFGLGVAGFASAQLSGWKSAHYSHSTIAETLSCTGVPGFLIYFGGQFAWLLLLLKLRRVYLPRQDAVIVAMMMAYFFVLQFFNVVGMIYDDRLLWPLTGAICGYLEHLRRRYVVAPVSTVPVSAW